jgi:hypothetical protein
MCAADDAEYDFAVTVRHRRGRDQRANGIGATDLRPALVGTSLPASGARKGAVAQRRAGCVVAARRIELRT